MSRSRYTFALQTLLDIFTGVLRSLFMDSLQALFPNNQPSAIPQRFGPGAEDAVINESI